MRAVDLLRDLDRLGDLLEVEMVGLRTRLDVYLDRDI